MTILADILGSMMLPPNIRRRNSFLSVKEVTRLRKGPASIFILMQEKSIRE